MRISESKSAMKINWNMINMIEQVFQATYVATLHYQPFSRLHSTMSDVSKCSKQHELQHIERTIWKGKENWISLPHTDGGVKAKDGISLLNFCSDKLLVLLTPYKTTVTIMCVYNTRKLINVMTKHISALKYSGKGDDGGSVLKVLFVLNPSHIATLLVFRPPATWEEKMVISDGCRSLSTWDVIYRVFFFSGTPLVLSTDKLI